MTRRNVLATAREPWLLVGNDPRRLDRSRAAVRAAGGAIAVLAGSRMRTADGVQREFATTMAFPDYFGHNWPGLEDCLVDLAWLPASGYLVAVEDAEEVLAQEPDELVGLFGDLLVRVARTWANPSPGNGWPDRSAVPFHVVLICSSAAAQEKAVARWSGAGVALADL
jgi:RNAse (barnase) inhibitor barstar